MPDSDQRNELLPQDPSWSYGDILPLARNKRTGELAAAVPRFLRGAINDLALAATVPGQVASGQMSLQQAVPLVPRMAIGLAGMGGMGEAPEGALRIFAGRTAKTADTAALSRAMSMESQGHAPGVIWDSTGWMKGPDGQWRFEIPDAGARLNAIDAPGRGVTVTPNKFSPDKFSASLEFPASQLRESPPVLGDIIQHPDLFAAYPDIAQTPVSPMPWVNAIEGTKGAVAGGKLYLSPAEPEEMLSTALHEMQHRVQDVEGFARGGSPGEFLPADFADKYKAASEAENYHRSLISDAGANPFTVQWALKRKAAGSKLADYEQNELNKVRMFYEDGDSVLKNFSAVLRKKKPLDDVQSKAFQNYQDLAGEVEARNVQERHASGETGFPPATPGYTPWEQQIVKFDHEGNAIPTHRLIPVEHDPFSATPVDHDPFNQEPTP